ncbi:MAG: MFS transporter [Alphaproteobacteria bacterium]|nr:MFS transporter [Alphaproteobacteria bacterium]
MAQEIIFGKKFLLAFLSLLTQAIVMYVLITTISEHATTLGATATVAGLISGIYIFGSLCSRFYSGHAMETIGWKKMAVWSSLFHCLVCGGYFFADGIGSLLFVRFIHGLSFGAASNAVATIGRSVLPKSRFAEGCGYLMLATTLAVGIGPFIGGQVYNVFGSNGCFVTAMIMELLSLLAVYFVDVRQLDPATCGKIKQKQIQLDPPVGINRYIEVRSLPISSVSALCGLGYVGIITFGRLFAASEDLVNVFSYFFLIYAFILIFSRPLAGKIQDKYGNKIICYPAILAQVIGLGVLALYPSIITVVLCAIGCGLGYGTILSANNAIACKAVPTHRLSYAVSTYYMSCDIAFGFGPAILGYLVSETNNYRLMYAVSALITFLALPLCIYALKGKR